MALSPQDGPRQSRTAPPVSELACGAPDGGPLPRPLADDGRFGGIEAVHENTPKGWYMDRPGYEERYDEWSVHASDSLAWYWPRFSSHLPF